jgi:hypothetical protein
MAIIIAVLASYKSSTEVQLYSLDPTRESCEFAVIRPALSILYTHARDYSTRTHNPPAAPPPRVVLLVCNAILAGALPGKQYLVTRMRHRLPARGWSDRPFSGAWAG